MSNKIKPKLVYPIYDENYFSQLDLDNEINNRILADDSLSTAISSEISSRVSGDVSLTTALSNSNVSSVSTALSSEISSRISGDLSLSTALSSEISSTNSDVTSLSSAVSTRISVDVSLSTALSTEISSTNTDITSLSTAVSSRVSADTSLSTAISTANSTRASADISLSTAISTANSTRASADISLSTALSSEISSTNTDITSLSTAVSTRIVVDSSLSTAINTKLSVSGGTVSPSFYINGLSNNATSNYIIYYNEISSGITYGLKPSGGDSYWQKSGTNVYIIDDNISVGTSTPSHKFTIGGTQSKSGVFENLLSINSNDATNQLRLKIGLINNATATSRGATIQAVEEGVAYRNLLLNPDGGNVGICTTAPYNKLTVEGATARIDINDGGGAGRKTIIIEPLGYNSNTYARIESYNYGTATGGNLVLNATGGRVGIGTTTPTSKLTVDGNIELTKGSNKYIRIGSASNYYYDLQSTGDNFQIIEGGDSNKVRLHISYPNGNVGIGTTSPSYDFESALSTASLGNKTLIVGGGNEIWSQPQTNSTASLHINYRGYADGYTQFRNLHIGNGKGTFIASFIGDNNNVGIGTTDPIAKLQVNGLIAAYRYSSASNLPAITMDKPSSYAYGIGPDGTAMRIRYGATTSLAGESWVDNGGIEHYFDGNINLTGELYLNGITNATQTNVLCYNSTSKKITYGNIQDIITLKGYTTEYNTAIGVGTANNLTTGTNNVYIGNNTGNGQTIAVGSTYVGSFVAPSSTMQNTLYGASAGYEFTTAYGNTCIGYCAGRSMIGTPLTTGTNNILIGQYAGYGLGNISNKFVVQNGEYSTPLLYGDFYDKYLNVNSALNVKHTSWQTPCVILTTTTDTLTEVIRLGTFATGKSVTILQAANYANESSYDHSGMIKMNTVTHTLSFAGDSDRRLKDNIINSNFDALSAVVNIPVRNFNFKNKTEKITGFVAQEVLNYYPQSVHYDNERDIYSLSWQDSLIPIYHKAIQQLNDKINELEKLIKNNHKYWNKK